MLNVNQLNKKCVISIGLGREGVPMKREDLHYSQRLVVAAGGYFLVLSVAQNESA